MRRRAAAILLVGLVLVAAACGDDDGEVAAGSRPSPTTAAEAGPRVRTEERTFATLRTLVVRPRGSGPYPLVVFVHGAGAPPELYGPFLEDLAAAGNVVVAPAMPGSYDQSDFGALAVLPFQPGRVEGVIDAVTEGSQAIGAADPERVVVMGHSLGGMTALATGFHTCCVDRRADAVVSIAGRLATFPDGTWSVGTAPVLLVHGEEDDVVPISGSGEALQQVGATAHLLTVLGADHSSYLGPGDDAYAAVLGGILAFVEATVGGDPQAGLADLATAGGMPGVRLTSRV